MITPVPYSPAQLAKLRTENQHSRLYLAVLNAPQVFACRVNQTFGTPDLVAQITYDGGVGVYSDVLPGQTLLVGTAAGLSDLGACRVRKAPTASLLYIGEGSEIAWADNLYLTVIDDFGLWPKHLRIVNNAALMDYDVAYSDQHTNFDPLPLMGPHAVAWLAAGSATVNFDASNSSVIGSSISSHAWSASPAAGISISGGSSATPTFTVTAPGTYRIRDLLTAANGKSFAGYRYIFAYDDAHPALGAFTLESCAGDAEDGGWTFRVTTPNSSAIQSLRAGTLVILFERASYGNVAGSVGTISGRENIIAMGWVAAENISADPEQVSVSFEVRGAHWWLKQMTAFPVGLELTGKTPSAWTNMQALTVDKALWHFLHWRCTATAVLDISLSGDARYASELAAPGASLWAQLETLSRETILARPAVNHLGQLCVRIPYNLLPVASRASIPNILAITAQDYAKTISLPRQRLPAVGQVILSGVAVSSGGSGSALFSLANGHVPKRLGAPLSQERLLLASQAQANELAGLLLADGNNPYPSLSIPFRANQRGWDIAPLTSASIALDDYSGLLTPRRVEVTHDVRSGKVGVTVEFAAATLPDLYTNGDIPITETGASWTPPAFIPAPIPPVIPLPPLMSGAQPRFAFVLTSLGLFYTETFNLDDPLWQALNAGFAAADYTDGFRALDVNQNGRYYVATKRKVYTGLAGWSASLLADETFFLSDFPVDPPFYLPYDLRGLGCNPAAEDEVAVMAGLPYPNGRSRFYLGSRAGFSSSVLQSYYNETGGGISWGPNGILLTYNTGIGFDAAITRMALDGLSEDHQALFSGWGFSLPHVRTLGLDRILTLNKSYFFTAEGETQSAELTKALIAAGCDETGLKILGAETVAPTLYRSTDGGAAWATVSIPKSNSSNAYIQALGGDQYALALRGNLAIESPGVYYTADFGDTLHDKTGNLLEVAGAAFDYVGLKVFP